MGSIVGVAAKKVAVGVAEDVFAGEGFCKLVSAPVATLVPIKRKSTAIRLKTQNCVLVRM